VEKRGLLKNLISYDFPFHILTPLMMMIRIEFIIKISSISQEDMKWLLPLSLGSDEN